MKAEMEMRRASGSSGCNKSTGDWSDARWKIISTLLEYPGLPEFHELLIDAKEWATELEAASLVAVVEQMLQVNMDDLVSEYVSRFDFQSKTCLYLTAHELGDSRKRGLALIALRRMLADAGLFELGSAQEAAQVSQVANRRAGPVGPAGPAGVSAPGGDNWVEEPLRDGQEELPDYIPLLFEFLAAKPAEFDASDLEKRLARVCETITENLPAESVYQQIFRQALTLLPDASLPAGGFVFAGREEADLDELPYPLFYD